MLELCLQFSLLDSAKHVSKCQGLHDGASLSEEQLKSCEVLDCTSDREKKKDPSASKVSMLSSSSDQPHPHGCHGKFLHVMC